MAGRSYFNRLALFSLPLILISTLALMQTQNWLKSFSARSSSTTVTSPQPDSAPCSVYGGLPDRGEREHNVPAFLIVGAQKAGTTYLHSLLKSVTPQLPYHI
jgi:hypothetical protein